MPAPAPRSAPGAPPSNDGRIDLNAATFELLRASKLSVTQAKRFIAQREAMGGFRSLEQIDGMMGFPRELKDWLRAHGRV